MTKTAIIINIIFQSFLLTYLIKWFLIDKNKSYILSSLFISLSYLLVTPMFLTTSNEEVFFYLLSISSFCWLISLLTSIISLIKKQKVNYFLFSLIAIDIIPLNVFWLAWIITLDFRL